MRSRVAVVAAVIMLFAAACGGDDSSGSDEGSGGDRSAQNDSVVAQFMDSGDTTMDEECIRSKVESLSDEDIAIIAVNGDEQISDAGQQTVASILECIVEG